MADAPFDQPKARRWFAVEFNNRALGPDRKAQPNQAPRRKRCCTALTRRSSIGPMWERSRTVSVAITCWQSSTLRLVAPNRPSSLPTSVWRRRGRPATLLPSTAPPRLPRVPRLPLRRVNPPEPTPITSKLARQPRAWTTRNGQSCIESSALLPLTSDL